MTQAERWHWVEWLAIIVAILSLWPWILGWPNPVWSILMYCMLALMAVLAVVNVRRLWRMGHPRPDDKD